MSEQSRPDMTDAQHERMCAIDAYVEGLIAQDYPRGTHSVEQVNTIRDGMFAYYSNGNGHRLPDERNPFDAYHLMRSLIREAGALSCLASLILENAAV